MANTAASTIITRTLDNLNRASAGTTRSGSTMETQSIAWLNRIMYRISRQHDFPELLKKYSSATVDGTKNYSFPTNYKTIFDLTVIDGYSSVKLALVLPEHFDKRIPYPEQYTERLPRWYVPYGDSFDLYPIPDDAYTLYCRCVLWPTIITATSDLVSFTPDKDDILVAGMTKEGFAYLQMYEDAAYWTKEYATLLQEAIALDRKLPDWYPVAQGFDSGYSTTFIGEYWNDPFIRSGYL